jgi:hypothetical protein
MPSRIYRTTVLFIALLATYGRQATPSSGPGRNYDGPAELPRVYVSSSVTSTPANGTVWNAKTSEQLREALKEARCGDVLKLEAGSTFLGQFHLEAKNCDDRHWIVIRTSADDSRLAPEGRRLTPCYAGTIDLPGRPLLHCGSTPVVTAKIVGNPPIDSLGASVDHYRFIGLEIAQPPGSSTVALINIGDNSRNLIVDRCWIHGNAKDNTRRAIALNGSNLAVVDSTITDVHEAGTDTQGIAAWTGIGPLKILNNFIEGGSSSIGFGGAGSNITPRDIEVRRNYLFKPLTWKLSDPNFLGVRFNCKVSFESKNSSRVLMEGNVLENAWGGPQGGDGDAVWLGPKNQNNSCPACEVNDITFRYNIIRHVGAGVYIFDAPSDAGGIAQQASRYSIHDNLLEDVRAEYAGPGTGRGILFRLAGSSRFAPPRDISIRHNTGVTDGSVLQLLTSIDAPIFDLTFQDNLFVSTGTDTISGCQGRYGAAVVSSCAKNFAFSNNVIAGPDGGFPKTKGEGRKRKDLNLNPKRIHDIGFVAPEPGADYRLCRGPGNPAPHCAQASAYAAAASDDRDLGADMDKINQLTKGADSIKRPGTGSP